MDARRTTPADQRRMHKLARESHTKADIGRIVGFSRKTVIKHLKQPAPPRRP